MNESELRTPTVPEAGLTVGRRAVRGAAMLTGATYVSIILGIAARKVIALVLQPVDVGIYQTALSFVDLVVSFAAFSFTSAIINVRENLIEEPLPHLKENVFILTVGVNALFTVLAMLLGLLSLTKVHGAVICGIIGVYAVQRFIASLDTFYTQILERELSYSYISRVTVIVNIVLHIAAVCFALLGGGAWAIPLATILSTAIGYWLDRRYVRASHLHTYHPQPWKYYDRTTARWLWKFGFRVLFNRVFESWLFKIDNLAIAFLFGSFYLGYYSQAFSIALLPSAAVAPIVARVSIATYAEVQHDRATLDKAFRVTNFFLVRLLVPAAIFVLVESKDLVRVFLSSNWGGAAEPLAALAGMVLTVPLFENAKMLLGATLRLREISIIRGGQLLLLMILIAGFNSGGVIYIALAVSLVNIIGYAVILSYLRETVDLHLNTIFLLPVSIGAAVLAIVLFGLDPLLRGWLPAAVTIGTAIARLLLIGPAILLLCFGLEFLVRPALYREYMSLVLAKLKRS